MQYRLQLLDPKPLALTIRQLDVLLKIERMLNLVNRCSRTIAKIFCNSLS